MIGNVKYRTTATAIGGRDGKATTQDGRLALRLSTPKELGGPGGEGTNPEQLFAAGYAACFLSALKLVSQQLKIHVPDDAASTATVGIGMRAQGGFGLAVDLLASLPGVTPSEAHRVVEAAHQVCPYSNATRNNIDVNLSVA